MQRDSGHMMDETDIGSGEKKQGERDTDKEVQKVRNPQMDGSTDGKRDIGGKTDRQSKPSAKTEKTHDDQSLDGPV